MIVDRTVNKSTIGVYLIDGDTKGTQLGLSKKPNWFRRFFVRMFLGWKWVSVSKLKTLK